MLLLLLSVMKCPLSLSAPCSGSTPKQAANLPLSLIPRADRTFPLRSARPRGISPEPSESHWYACGRRSGKYDQSRTVTDRPTLDRGVECAPLSAAPRRRARDAKTSLSRSSAEISD